MAEEKKELVTEAEKKALLHKSKSALQQLAERLAVEPERLKVVLKATVCRGMKGDDGKMRPMTDEELFMFIVICNKYDLNPFLKEIYAYGDKKSGAVIPVVSTDGWTKAILRNERYRNHYFVYAEKSVTMPGGKPCPEWIECVMVKQDGTEVRIREYLDECYREAFKNRDGQTISGPWQTHTKRMFRHKVKIQSGREALGICGIYDKDEAERILDGQIVNETAEIAMPQPIKKLAGPEKVKEDEKIEQEKIDDFTADIHTEPKPEEPKQEEPEQPAAEKFLSVAEAVDIDLSEPANIIGVIKDVISKITGKNKAVEFMVKDSKQFDLIRISFWGDFDKSVIGKTARFYNVKSFDAGAETKLVASMVKVEG